MPRSRTSRSSSPQTQRPPDTAILNERQKTFRNVKEIFQPSLDDEIIRMVLIECNWKDEVAIDKLLAIAEDAEAQTQYKQNNSQLRKIAEGVFGPLSFEDYKTHGTHRASVIPDSKLSATEKIIGRPKRSEEGQSYRPTSVPVKEDYLVPRGSNTHFKSRANPGSDKLDVHFPKLPAKTAAPTSTLSSDGSQSQQSAKYAGVFRDATFKSQAQSACNQQFDDAASAQRWEQYKQTISEHYVEKIEHSQVEDKTLITEKHESQAEHKRQERQVQGSKGVCESSKDQQTSRLQTSRSFPVRLLGKDLEKEEDLVRPNFKRLDSADLDENILKCILEVQVNTIKEEVFKEKKSENEAATPQSGSPHLRTPTPSNVSGSPHLRTPIPSNGPMTLPVIGLSVEAEEFVPRLKPSKVENAEQTSTQPSLSPSVQAVSKASKSNPSLSTPTEAKVSKSNPIEIKPGARNFKNGNSSPGVSISSPILKSPVSPGSSQYFHGRSPPVSANSSAALTGSPVFLTYKWPHGIPGVSAAGTHQPHIITASPRYITGPPPQPHLAHAAAYRLHGPPNMPYPNRMVYPMATQPPFYRMTSVPPPHMTSLRPPPVHMPRLPTELEERAAIATGSPIMTGSELQRKIPQHSGVKLLNPGWIVQCIQKIQEKQKSGKKVMVIVRGLPGSGKSTLSRSIQMDGVVLSTDDFFVQGGYYKYNHDKLTESHQWNRERAKESMKMGTTPIIIDNTNTQKWEFKSYVSMAINNNYSVEILEPNTPWKFKPSDLATKNLHGVPKDQIQRMMSRYEHNISLETVVGKSKPRTNEKNSQVQRAAEDDGYSEKNAGGKTENENVKPTDNNRSWDLNEVKAAHLSRHLSDSPVTNSIRTSSLDRIIVPPVYSGSQRTASVSSAGTTTPDPDNEDIETIKYEADIDNHDDIMDQDGLHLLDKSSSSLTSSPPSLKFEKGNSVLSKSSIGKRKAKSKDIRQKIFEVTAKLSVETLSELNMLDVYMKDTDVPENVKQKRKEELIAFLQLLPIEEDERNAAETLIHLKLHDSHIDKDDASDTESDELEDETVEVTQSPAGQLSHEEEVSPETEVSDPNVLNEDSSVVSDQALIKGIEEKNDNFGLDEHVHVEEVSSDTNDSDLDVSKKSSGVRDQAFIKGIEEMNKSLVLDELVHVEEVSPGTNLSDHDVFEDSPRVRDQTLEMKIDEKNDMVLDELVHVKEVSSEPDLCDPDMLEGSSVVSDQTLVTDIEEMNKDLVFDDDLGVTDSISIVENAQIEKESNVVTDQRLSEESQFTKSSSSVGLESVNNPSVLLQASDIELQYWNKIDKDETANSSTILKDNTADLWEDWGEGKINGAERSEDDLIKPQRVKKQKLFSNKSALNLLTENICENDEVIKIKSDSDEVSAISNQNDNNQLVECAGIDVNSNTCCAVKEIKVELVSSGANSVIHKVLDDKVTPPDKTEQHVSEYNETLAGESVDIVVDDDGKTDVDKAYEFINCKIQEKSQTIDSSNKTDTVFSVTSHIVNNVPSSPYTHNSSLHLLKENYSDIDMLEDQSAQDDFNGSSSSSDMKDVLQLNLEANKKLMDEVIGSDVFGTVKRTVVGEEAVSIDSTKISLDGTDKMADNIVNDVKKVSDKVVDKDRKASDIDQLTQVCQPPEKQKRKTHRKLAAKFQAPLISSEDKKKMFSNDWSLLTVANQPIKSVTAIDTGSHSEDFLILVEDATMTSDEDFMEVDNLERGGFISSSLKYLVGTSKKIVNDNHQESVEALAITKVHLVHKSTSTDDLEEMSYSDSVKFLKTCFPDVREDELECVLVNCQDNVEWAINLLLDWKYSLHLTEDEKQKFVDGMEKVNVCNKPMIQPSTLTDLCFTLIELQNIATRQELEEQLIETTKDRLNRVENENLTKIRLHRSSSLNESIEESKNGATNTANLSPNAFKRSQSDPNKVGGSLAVLTEMSDEKENLSNKEVTSNVKSMLLNNASTQRDSSLNAEQLDDSTIKSNRICDGQHVVKEMFRDANESVVFVDKCEDYIDAVTGKGDYRKNLNDRKREKIKRQVEMRNFVGLKRGHAEVDEMVGVITDDSVGIDVTEEMSTPALTINLPRDIVVKLEQLFGPLKTSADKGHFPVPVDHKTAFSLYQCIKQGMVSHSRKQQQLVEDEEMARLLQEQEDAVAYLKRGDIGRQKPAGKQRKYVPLDERLAEIQTQEEANTIHVPLPVKSFESIMLEEEAKEKKKQKFQKLLEDQGGTSSMSTRVKRLQLYEHYSTVDRSEIDRCFEANCYNMSETIQAMNCSLGRPKESSRALNGNKDLDKSLMESTKQQSMQEMLDSYLYIPKVNKDYQDGADPDYEDFRGEANLHFRMRHECFQKAQAAFKQGLRQVASFYSQQGHLHTQKIKEANMRASEQILAERNTDLTKNGTLDLHGLHIDEAIAALDRIMPDLERDHIKKHIIIITGRGSHSRGGIARLRPSVIAYLKRYQYTFVEEQTGVIKVNLKYRRSDR